MVIDRRQLLQLGGVALAGHALTLSDRARAGTPSSAVQLFAAARKGRTGYSAAIFDQTGQDHAVVSLPARGHDVAVCQRTKQCVVFARRPGNFAVAFSVARRSAPVSFTTPPDRHFYGHGTFSSDGSLLFATENDFEAARGCIGVYDVKRGFHRVGEFPTHGIGPHDLALLPDGQTLVVANGGVETHPDIGRGRTSLNLATMEPSLVYIDTRTGDVIERHTLPASSRRLSLRHLDIGQRRTVVIGGQVKASSGRTLPLILTHRLGTDLAPVTLPNKLARSLRGYISSVAVSAAGDLAALTSSRGGAVVFVDVASGRYLGTRHVQDVSGVAPAATDGFLLTSGTGALAIHERSGPDGPVATSAWHWDNHAVRVR